MSNHDATAAPVELTIAEIGTIAGGMINLYEPGENPNQQQAGRLVSLIGYRTIADYGL